MEEITNITKGKTPKNRDYPITRWISDNAAKPDQNITEKEFYTDPYYTYSTFILDKNVYLNNLERLRNVTYSSQ